VEKKLSKPNRILEIGSPFFPDESKKKIYLKALRKQLGEGQLFQGNKALQWELSPNSSPTDLYAPESNLGLLAVTNLGATAYYARRGLLKPLDQLFPHYQHTYLDAGWRKGFVDGHIYSVPQHVSIRLLFYRKDLLKKYFFTPPHTWDEMERQIKTITKEEKDPKLQGLLMNFNPTVRFSIFLDHLWSQAADLYENGPDWTLNRKALGTALNQMNHFFQTGMTPKDVFEWDYPRPYAEFLAGRSVFLHHWSDGIDLINHLPADQKENFGWCPLPSVSFNTPGKSMLGGLNYVIPRNTRYPEAAFKVLASIMEERFQHWYAETLGSPFPAMKSVYLEKSIRQSHPHLDQAEFFLRHGKSLEECSYFQNDYLDWMSIGSQELTFFLEGKASTTEAIQRMEERFSPLLPKKAFTGLTDKAMEYIETHLETHVKVEDIAKHLNITPEHFIRVFKQNTRRTPLRYINDAKMERAKVLLKKSPLTIGEIAYRLGYKNRDHFSRLFHKLVKHSPSEYRN
jgi:ABC-type glycerol-3-phosphate transport system substrate-binding protein/AraC-like DNA-binding protein